MVDEEKAVLVDVDGVILDLFGAAFKWRTDHGGKALDIDRPLIHDDLGGEIYGALKLFMSLDHAYSLVEPLPGAIDGLERLHLRGYKIVFNTTIMSTSKGTYGDKYDRLDELIAGRFPFKYAAVPSNEKHMMHADIAFDDRADICLRYARSGTPPVLVLRRWSFGGCPETKTIASTVKAFKEIDVSSHLVWDDSETRLLSLPEISGDFDLPKFEGSFNAWGNVDAIIDTIERRKNGVLDWR